MSIISLLLAMDQSNTNEMVQGLLMKLPSYEGLILWNPIPWVKSQDNQCLEMKTIDALQATIVLFTIWNCFSHAQIYRLGFKHKYAELCIS